MIAQKWEYRSLVRSHLTMQRDREIRTDGAVPSHRNRWDLDFAQLLPALGDEG